VDVVPPDGVEDLGLQIADCRLMGVYPNPFNAIARVEYALPVPGRIRLHLYDLSGRQLKAFHDGWSAAGRSSVILDMSEYPAGVYLLRLKSGGRVQIQKAVVIR